jgi:hypothetical protein
LIASVAEDEKVGNDEGQVPSQYRDHSNIEGLISDEYVSANKMHTFRLS